MSGDTIQALNTLAVKSWQRVDLHPARSGSFKSNSLSLKPPKLAEGAARLRFDDEVFEIQLGDCIYIPSHGKRRVDRSTPAEPTIWRTYFTREQQCAAVVLPP